MGGSTKPARPLAAAVLAVALAAALPGCAGVRSAVGALTGTPGAGVVDAHTVYRLRPGCAAVAARSLDHGFTVLTPRAALVVEPTGLFEGPARTGESVFRYLPPGEGETWDRAQATDVPVTVHAVELALPDVRAWMDRLCGPLVPGEAGSDVPRLPGTPPEATPDR